MRHRIFFFLLAAFLLVSIQGARAEPFVPKMNDPTSYKDARFGADETRSNIETVDCGGFALNTHATASGSEVTAGDVPIADISADVPGRRNVDNKILSDAKNGLGIRSDFEYPDTAWGYMSACSIYTTSIHDDDLAAAGKDVKLHIDDANDPNSGMSVDIVDGNGNIDINPNRWCIRYDKATPAWCKKLYEWLKMLSTDAPHPSFGNPLCLTGKKYCFDSTDECNGQGCRTLFPPSFSQTPATCHQATDASGTLLTDANGNPVVINDSPAFFSADESSFYRHYSGGFMHPGISVKELFGIESWHVEIKEWKVRGECYEYYGTTGSGSIARGEWDPKDIVTGLGDEQCEFVISESNNSNTGESNTDEGNPDTPEWVEGNGHKQKEGYTPDPAVVAEPDRDTRNVLDPWVADTKTNLSMIDIKKLKDLQNKFSNPADPNGVLGAILPAKQKATMTTHARTDMFDDTSLRKLSSFWEDQQKELLKMVADPTTKLVMPIRLFVGLDEKNPVFQYVRNVISKSSGLVEVTLRAGPEDLGLLLTSLTRNLMTPLREVRIPVLVPLVSEEEINTRIFEWRQWKMQEDRAAVLENRASLSGQADPLIAKLQQYRDAAKKERLMRGALAKYLQKLFDGQQKIQNFIAQFYQLNSAAIKTANRRTADRRRLQWIWQQIQRAMLQTDECQLQWCSNQRYTVAIYSLLDNWWGDQEPGDDRNLDYQPESLTDLGFEQPEDQVFDFSKMGFSTGGLLVPVLVPVQVKLNLPLPPTAKPPPDPSLFPDLPTYPDETVFDSFPVPLVILPDPPPSFTPVTTGDLTDAMRIMRDFRKIIDGTSIDDQKQQETQAMSGNPPPDDNGPWNDRTSMRGVYCRFPPSITIPPDEAHGNPAKIIHVENDLKERLSRLFARWLPERMEDVAGRVARLNAESSNPDCHEDVVCLALSPEKTTTANWQWFINLTSDAFNTLADDMRSKTCDFCTTDPPDESKNPYLDAPIEILRRVFPRTLMPTQVDLFFRQN